MADYTYNSIRKSYDDDEDLNKKLDEKINANNTIYDTNAQTISNTYNQQIKDTEDDYEDAHRENAVQTKINEHYIAEEMANMGLSNSGLNRTQITANQLSYANNKAKLDRQRQSMVDSLTLEMTNKLAENENSRLSSEQSIRDTDSQYRDSLATSEYNTRVEADTEKYKAEQERLDNEAKYKYDYDLAVKKANIQAQTEITKAGITAQNSNSYIIKQDGATLSHDFTGSLEENGISIIYNEDTTTYIDNNSGKQTTVPKSVNPYTGDNNATGTGDTAKAWTEYGYFDHGYQPKGVVFEGEYYGYVLKSVGTDVIHGKRVNIHLTKDGSLWIWDDRQNCYLRYDANGDGKYNSQDLVRVQKDAK